MSKLEKLIGSGLSTGFIKKASGTWGSLAALAIYLLPGFENPALLILLISISFVFGIPIANKFEKVYGKDPKEFTLDEFVGMWITLLFLPKSLWLIIPAFFIWRAFDIFKPFPVNRLEKLKGGLGIFADDIMAGFYSFLIMQILTNILYHFI
ncbi:MAG: phosphatidylglycerophosphatase A [Melioribacteraceae bacterium]